MPLRKDVFLEELPCRLSEEEIDERGREAGALAADLERFKEHAKKEKKKLTDKEKDMTEKLFGLGKAVETGVETRDVGCYEHANLARYVVETVRMDTGTVVRTRPMDEQERKKAAQGDLFDFAESDQTERLHQLALLERQREQEKKRVAEEAKSAPAKKGAKGAVAEAPPAAESSPGADGPEVNDDDLPKH